MPNPTSPQSGTRAAAPIRVLLVEDHKMVAEALGAAFEEFPEIQLVASVESLAHGMIAVEEHLPDIVLLDRRLPDGDGIEAITRLRALSPSSRVLVLTGDANSAIAARILEVGGAGLLLKSGLLDELITAIRTVAAGDVIIDPELLSGALAMLAGSSGPLGPVLSLRERQVLGLIADGAGTDRIAEELRLARNTVRNHVQRILVKTGTHSKLEAVAHARKNGLLERP
ncbi:response regulator [Amycolatopsis regifaucium]|uniref:DNA-binding response regulator n=1 Tax=Amycolatopsis regifaucium TaxID=546365 RepID=A0A154MPK2_9PSEU|nr:response regulator transcription factor [Amycolatopsis regifaucium]KZB86185.1 two-component system response regulator [Amycolatopsis regifaucium]OKA05076.1 DNA-binding response regulator [Amycolatopsis regifaucium]SFH81193.1 DNA-binding response regulator, NarL/FixJ family, contains REC and HTH domains [Amycolatopsis regifaucium]